MAHLVQADTQHAADELGYGQNDGCVAPCDDVTRQWIPRVPEVLADPVTEVDVVQVNWPVNESFLPASRMNIVIVVSFVFVVDLGVFVVIPKHWHLRHLFFN